MHDNAPAKTRHSAHQGTINGLPVQLICVQSNVNTLIPKPLYTPNSWFTGTLFGTIHAIQLNTFKVVKVYPGKSFLACRGSSNVHATRFYGQTMIAGQTRNLRHKPARPNSESCVARMVTRLNQQPCLML